jgi:enterochelin esterase-like enzyme
MSVAIKSSRTQVWMENLGDWAWPGTAAAAEMMPPSWVPAFPPRLETVAAGAVGGSWEQQQRSLTRRLGLGALMSALAAVSMTLALKGPAGLERLVGYGSSSATVAPEFAAARASRDAQPPLPTLATYSSTDEAGSEIDVANYSSAALHGTGSFYVYLPAGYASTTRHYPVIYLLHGNSQPATAFLQIGLQGELDSLIAHHEVPPMIAVMIQGGPGSNNWRNHWGGRDYGNYVLEVQQLVDRMLPTIPARNARAIAGDSMGGYGAMNIALGNPYRFGVVESWLGFFNGLGGQLHADAPVISRLGLHAFLYGAESDHIANPAENQPFAAALRAEGARATSILYPGGHSLETVEAHLGSMLTFAGHTLATRIAPAPALAARAASARTVAPSEPVASSTASAAAHGAR